MGIDPVGFGQFADRFGKVAHAAWMADDYARLAQSCLLTGLLRLPTAEGRAIGGGKLRFPHLLHFPVGLEQSRKFLTHDQAWLIGKYVLFPFWT